MYIYGVYESAADRRIRSHLATGGDAAVVRRPRGRGGVADARGAVRLHAPRAEGPSGAGVRPRPGGWLAATLAVLARGEFDLLMPTQEQVTILARDAARLPVPCRAAVVRERAARAGQGGAAAGARGAGAAAPRVRRRRAQPACGAASRCSRRRRSARRARACASSADRASLRAADGDFGGGPVVLQEPLAGPLVMVQAIFDSGRLVAWHATLREREGAGGGSSSKLSFSHPAVPRDLARLGAELDWHGALSLDAILTPDGPSYIDVNPRLVEPGNAWRAGVDLVGALVGVSLGSDVAVAPQPRPGRANASAAAGGARRGAARARASWGGAGAGAGPGSPWPLRKKRRGADARAPRPGGRRPRGSRGDRHARQPRCAPVVHWRGCGVLRVDAGGLGLHHFGRRHRR